MKLKINNELSPSTIKALFIDACYNWSNNVDNSVDLTDIYITDNGERIASYSIVLVKVKHSEEIFMKLMDAEGNKKDAHSILSIDNAQTSYMYLINIAKDKLKKKYLSTNE